MSRRRMPWYRAYCELHTNEDYLMMSLEQQAVYHNLRDYAAGQSCRGTFQVRNLEALARLVAAGRSDVLQDVLDYCSMEWVDEAGRPHIEIADGRGRFTTWEKWQRKPSDEPERVAERQERFKERHNAPITRLKRGNNAPVEEEVDRDKEIVAAGHTKRAREEPAASLIASLELTGEPAALVEKAMEAYPDVLHELELESWRNQNPGWRRLAPPERARRFAKWLAKAEAFRQQDEARASPNGHSPPPALSTLPDDPEEDALWRQRDEELRAKAHERSKQPQT